MYELVLTVCTIVGGATCRELQPLALQEHTGALGCLIAAQIEGEKWANQHPNYYISRYTCQPAKTYAKI
jgi:hypothetical protein